MRINIDEEVVDLGRAAAARAAPRQKDRQNRTNCGIRKAEDATKTATGETSLVGSKLGMGWIAWAAVRVGVYH